MIHPPICPSRKLETLLLFNLSHSLIIRRYLGWEDVGMDEQTALWRSRPGVSRTIRRDSSSHSTEAFFCWRYPFQIDCVYIIQLFKKKSTKCNSDRNRWTKKHLTYDIKAYTSQLSRSQVDHEIARAFKFWQNASVLTFTQVTTGQADIVIRYTFGCEAIAL